MTAINLGIIGGGQLGSMLANAAKKLNINVINQDEWIKMLDKTS